MTESFWADSPEVRALGKLVADTGIDIEIATTYLREHGLYESGGELLQSLSPVISGYCAIAADRFADRARECADIGIELNRAAWLYDSVESQNYELLNQNIITTDGDWTADAPEAGPARDYPTDVMYSKVEEAVLTPPDPPADDLAMVIRDATDWLGEIDGRIEELIEVSPVQGILRPLTGNWNVLRSVGAAHASAGEAMRISAENLAAGVRQVDPYWDGAAAIAFTDHAVLVEKAIRAEQPAGATIDMMLNLAADQIHEGISMVVSTFEDELARVVEVDNAYEAVRLLLKRFTSVGLGLSIYEITQVVRHAYNNAQELKEGVERVVDSIRTVLDFMSDPAGVIEQTLRDEIAPILDRAGDAAEKVRIVDTIMDAGAGAADIADAPDEAYSTGTADEPWRDAL